MSSSRVVKTMIDLPDWQFIGIIVSIVGSAVGATAWITWRLSKVTTEVDNLKDNVKKIEDDLKYMFRLDLELAGSFPYILSQPQSCSCSLGVSIKHSIANSSFLEKRGIACHSFYFGVIKVLVLVGLSRVISNTNLSYF